MHISASGCHNSSSLASLQEDLTWLADSILKLPSTLHHHPSVSQHHTQELNCILALMPVQIKTFSKQEQASTASGISPWGSKTVCHSHREARNFAGGNQLSLYLPSRCTSMLYCQGTCNPGQGPERTVHLHSLWICWTGKTSHARS